VVMRDGKIQQADAAMKTYHEPANRFVAGFIGMPPMNFFPGHLRRGPDGGLAFEEAAAPQTNAGPGGTPLAGADSAAELTAAMKGFTLTLSRLRSGVPDRLASRVGSSVVLGIRPEHLSLRPIASEDGSVVSQPVELGLTVVEPLGSEVDLYLRSASNDSVVARVEAPAGESLSEPRVGSVARVHVDLRRVHLFEPGEAGLNLSLENVSMQTASTGQSAADELSHAKP
ncbi:MAG TPA: TOBE domain-containing protein, partial [Humisphaera sp.]